MGQYHRPRSPATEYVLGIIILSECSQVSLTVYDWQALEQDAVICDVGGNNGHATLDLVKGYPKLKVVVQDLASLRPRWSEVCLSNRSTRPSADS